jgi:hypothetical protein
MSQSTLWRQSTKREIQQYYNEEFEPYIDRFPDWITPNGPKQYALAFRENHPTKHPKRDPPDRDFVRRHTRNKYPPNQVFIHDWDKILDFLRHPASKDPMTIDTGNKGLVHPDTANKPDPAPAAAYYALDNWDRFWVLAFDIDAKDVAKQAIAGDDQTFEDVTDEQVENSGIINMPPEPHFLPPEDSTGTANGDGNVAQYKYRFEDIERTLELAFDLKEWLVDKVEFPEVRVFYSGQGAHIYALEDDPKYKFTYQTRRFLTTYIHERLNIPVDDAVTWDRNRVMRLPYSLHTDVSRVVTEIESPDFDFRNDTQPAFLTGNQPKSDH